MTDCEQYPGFHVELVEGSFVRSRWGEVCVGMQAAFVGAEFTETACTPDVPVLSTNLAVADRWEHDFRHTLAFEFNRAGQERIIGGIFGIEAHETLTSDAGLGWIYTVPSIPIRRRPEVMDAMMSLTFDALRGVNVQRVVTSIGTRAGERMLSRRYGFKHDPHIDEKNRWVRDLRDKV